MPRSREFEPQEVLGKAMELFWQQGYTKTSIDDLVAYTGVSRYGLYSAFGDKHDLFVAVLRRYRKICVSQMLAPMEAPDADVRAIHHYFSVLANASTSPVAKRGCLVCNTIVELPILDNMVAEQVQGHLDRLHKAFLHALGQGQVKGQLPHSWDLDGYADYLVGVAIGLVVLLRSPMDHAAIERFIKVALAALP